MGDPLFKASQGGRFDILRVWEDIIQSEARQVSGREVLISIKRAPRSRPPHHLGGVALRQAQGHEQCRMATVLLIRRNATLSDQVAHARPVRFFATGVKLSGVWNQRGAPVGAPKP